ncbi:MAG: hypothetical protein ACLT76_18305 [Clostridium fessum]
MLKDILAKGKLRDTRQMAASDHVRVQRHHGCAGASPKSLPERSRTDPDRREGGMGHRDPLILDIDGVAVMEVVDDERFYDAFPLGAGGMAALLHAAEVTEDSEHAGTCGKAGAHKINVLVACGQTCKTVPEDLQHLLLSSQAAHTEGGGGYLYQNRSLSDVFVLPEWQGRQGGQMYMLTWIPAEYTGCLIGGDPMAYRAVCDRRVLSDRVRPGNTVPEDEHLKGTPPGTPAAWIP